MYITEARSVLLSSAGPGKDPENRPVSFWVFLSSEKLYFPSLGGMREDNVTDAGSWLATALTPQTP